MLTVIHSGCQVFLRKDKGILIKLTELQSNIDGTIDYSICARDDTNLAPKYHVDISHDAHRLYDSCKMEYEEIKARGFESLVIERPDDYNDTWYSIPYEYNNNYNNIYDREGNVGDCDEFWVRRSQNNGMSHTLSINEDDGQIIEHNSQYQKDEISDEWKNKRIRDML